MGDDNEGTVHTNYRDLYNMTTLHEAMKTYGMVYTDEHKQKPVIPLKPLVECEFMKRGYRYEPYLGRFLGPLTLNTVLEMSSWTKKDNPDNIAVDNAVTSLYELSFHGKDVYEHWAPQIVKAVRQYYPHVKINPARPLEMSFYERLNEACNIDSFLH